jgi:hypothetical protein
MEESQTELRRPEVCSKCGDTEVQRIVYGPPTAESWQLIERGQACLGGCFVRPWLPDWRCNSCRHEWFVADDPVKQEREIYLQELLKKHRNRAP